MKAPHPYNTPRPHGEWRPTPPHGQVQGRHVARKGSASQSSLLGPDLHRRTPDPYTYKSRAPKKARQVPWEGPSPPPSKVRALARSRDRKDPGMRRGPVLARVQALPCASCYWSEACGISQRAKPDVKSTKPCNLRIYCRKDASPATTLTGEVPSQHLICPVQSDGRRRQGHPVGGAPDRSVGKQCVCAEQRTVLIIPSTRSLPCTPRIWRSWVSGH
jgi:hypothetical protein